MREADCGRSSGNHCCSLSLTGHTDSSPTPPSRDHSVRGAPAHLLPRSCAAPLRESQLPLTQPPREGTRCGAGTQVLGGSSGEWKRHQIWNHKPGPTASTPLFPSRLRDIFRACNFRVCENGDSYFPVRGVDAVTNFVNCKELKKSLLSPPSSMEGVVTPSSRTAVTPRRDCRDRLASLTLTWMP